MGARTSTGRNGGARWTARRRSYRWSRCFRSIVSVTKGNIQIRNLVIVWDRLCLMFKVVVSGRGVRLESWVAFVDSWVPSQCSGRWENFLQIQASLHDCERNIHSQIGYILYLFETISPQEFNFITIELSAPLKVKRSHSYSRNHRVSQIKENLQEQELVIVFNFKKLWVQLLDLVVIKATVSWISFSLNKIEQLKESSPQRLHIGQRVLDVRLKEVSRKWS
jgi:hypothetical protein